MGSNVRATIKGPEDPRSDGEHKDTAAPPPVRVLLIGPADCRHTVTTICRSHRWLRHDVELYIYEPRMAPLARHIALLALMFDDQLLTRSRVEMLLELHGNVLVREKTAEYLEELGKKLALLVHCSQLHATPLPNPQPQPTPSNKLINPLPSVDKLKPKSEQLLLEKISPVLLRLIDLSLLRHKECDALADLFCSWRRKVPFDIAALRDRRMRKYFGERYDFQRNLADWDYSMALAERAPVVHSRNFKDWRATGIAYRFRDCVYTEPNRSLQSWACGRTLDYVDRNGEERGRTIEQRGFWGDILNGPYPAFSIATENRNLMKTRNGVHLHTETELAVFNLTSLLYELQHSKIYRTAEEKGKKVVVAEVEQSESDCKSESQAHGAGYSMLPTVHETSSELGPSEQASTSASASASASASVSVCESDSEDMGDGENGAEVGREEEGERTREKRGEEERGRERQGEREEDKNGNHRAGRERGREEEGERARETGEEEEERERQRQGEREEDKNGIHREEYRGQQACPRIGADDQTESAVRDEGKSSTPGTHNAIAIASVLASEGETAIVQPAVVSAPIQSLGENVEPSNADPQCEGPGILSFKAATTLPDELSRAAKPTAADSQPLTRPALDSCCGTVVVDPRLEPMDVPGSSAGPRTVQGQTQSSELGSESGTRSSLDQRGSVAKPGRAFLSNVDVNEKDRGSGGSGGSGGSCARVACIDDGDGGDAIRSEERSDPNEKDKIDIHSAHACADVCRDAAASSVVGGGGGGEKEKERRLRREKEKEREEKVKEEVERAEEVRKKERESREEEEEEEEEEEAEGVNGLGDEGEKKGRRQAEEKEEKVLEKKTGEKKTGEEKEEEPGDKEEGGVGREMKEEREKVQQEEGEEKWEREWNEEDKERKEEKKGEEREAKGEEKVVSKDDEDEEKLEKETEEKQQPEVEKKKKNGEEEIENVKKEMEAKQKDTEDKIMTNEEEEQDCLVEGWSENAAETLDLFKLVFITGDLHKVVLQKPMFRTKKFDAVVIGVGYAQAFDNVDMNSITKDDARIVVEGSRFILGLRKEHQAAFVKKMDEIAERLGWEPALTHESLAEHLVYRKRVVSS
ncbi:hypothetical protein CBR_g45441 [Chara braunii]|uniref:Dynein assembly factor 3, axonemal n=1 Tax=Chara braunii TaxID=69332 RepID=A0A388LYI5_CHABU|nr:hypothetical protein CBR_g45441 [Chara braunii]|eukprot:GBG87384.1 hypothetical protein CBR_g45441 [Chara braunii]